MVDSKKSCIFVIGKENKLNQRIMKQKSNSNTSTKTTKKGLPIYHANGTIPDINKKFLIFVPVR